MGKQPAVYILASKQNGTLYIGVTIELAKRAWTHKNDVIERFTKRYGVHRDRVAGENLDSRVRGND